MFNCVLFIAKKFDKASKYQFNFNIINIPVEYCCAANYENKAGLHKKGYIFFYQKHIRNGFWDLKKIDH
jgi:hypothetical protein